MSPDAFWLPLLIKMAVTAAFVIVAVGGIGCIVAGLLASLDLSGTGPFLGSDFEYVRLFSQLHLFRSGSLAGPPFTWALRILAFGVPPLPSLQILIGEGFLGDTWYKNDGTFATPAYQSTEPRAMVPIPHHTTASQSSSAIEPTT